MNQRPTLHLLIFRSNAVEERTRRTTPPSKVPALQHETGWVTLVCRHQNPLSGLVSKYAAWIWKLYADHLEMQALPILSRKAARTKRCGMSPFECTAAASRPNGRPLDTPQLRNGSIHNAHILLLEFIQRLIRQLYTASANHKRT